MNTLSDLFPKARSEIFRLLFETQEKENHLREIARLAGLSPGALQKELTALASKELVLTRRDGNRLYYRANAAHPLYPELHGLVVKTAGVVPELRRALAPVGGIELAFIFGSTAAGTANSGSDVDLLILGNAGLRKVSAALRGITESIGREINPICFTSEEWRQKRLRGDGFASRVFTEPKLWLKGGPDALEAMEG